MSSEEQAKDTVERLNAVLNTVLDGIVTISANGIIETFNPAAERIFGYSVEEVVGHNVKMLMPEPYHGEHDGYLHNYLTSGQARVIGTGREVVGRRKDGSTFPMELAVSEMSVAGRRMFTGIVRDISERRDAEQELRDSEQRFRSMVENAGDAIYIHDRYGKIYDVNQVASHQTGFAYEELLALNVAQLDAGVDFENLREAWDLGVADPSRYPITLVTAHRRKDGSVFPIEVRISLLPREGDYLYVAVVRDITERRRIERMKDEFVSIVSHELRTPLTSISGALGLVEGGAVGELPSAARQMVDIALKNSQRLAHLINDLLDMEKITAGKMHFDLHVQALRPLISQALESNQAYGAARRVRLALSGEVPDVMVRVDAQRFMQVMSNLLSNAIKYSHEDGVVEIKAVLDAAVVRIMVIDHGSGIPAEFRERIFQKFAQADSSDTRQKGGTGLGLAITRELVEHMGGRVGFDSVEGQGASFFFELPLSAAHGADPQQG